MAKAAGGPASKDDVFSVERIRDLIGLMKEHDLSEVDLKQADQQIRLVRGGQVISVAAPAVSMAPVAAAPTSPQAPAASEPTGPAADGPHIKVICSPMVGTFYSKPNPNSEDFVKVGSKVSTDTVVCTVEAMKVFNEIPAEISGTIVAVLAKNEDAVDFNRPLFKVDTRG
jgi:acetyl-CoA carboxylase biotin carboxyl carrier protein